MYRSHCHSRIRQICSWSLSDRLCSRNTRLRDHLGVLVSKWVPILDLRRELLPHPAEHRYHPADNPLPIITPYPFIILGAPIGCRCTSHGPEWRNMFHSPFAHPGAVPSGYHPFVTFLEDPTNPPKSSCKVYRSTLSVCRRLPGHWVPGTIIHYCRRSWGSHTQRRFRPCVVLEYHSWGSDVDILGKRWKGDWDAYPEQSAC